MKAGERNLMTCTCQPVSFVAGIRPSLVNNDVGNPDLVSVDLAEANELAVRLALRLVDGEPIVLVAEERGRRGSPSPSR
jgi:hypothetical protein